jgi:hypothetical protein
MLKRAAAGGIVWLTLLFVSALQLMPLWTLELLFLLAPLVLVPMAFGLIGTQASSHWLVAAERAQPWAAYMAAASFVPPRGPLAAAASTPWLIVTLLGAAHAAVLAWKTPIRGAEQTPRLAGLLMLPVGAGWLLLSRLGARPLGFEEPLPLLTAVHFHYAAFLAPVLVAEPARLLGTCAEYRLFVAGTCAAPPLIAAGITFSPPLELAGAALLAVSLGGFAVLTLWRAVPQLPRGGARALVATSSFSALGGMLLALLWAGGSFFDAPLVSLSQMAHLHGALNAIGFCGLGLLGWALLRRNLSASAL